MLLAAATMVVEIVVGYATGSMALLADGWHMATHVGALGIASASYLVARRFAAHAAFGFGTAKVPALAGYTSALALGVAAVAMLVESLDRLTSPGAIDFAGSLPVAFAGLAVNLLSIALLHHHDDHDRHAHELHDGERDARARSTRDPHVHDPHEHRRHRQAPEDDRHEPGDQARDRRDAHSGHAHSAAHREHCRVHDHNHRAVVLHVVADALTSALAITALTVGYLTGVTWLDALSGIVGAVFILHWAVGLCRTTSVELLDVDPSGVIQSRIREALEHPADARVVDLHVWSIGGGRHGCVATIVASAPLAPDVYHARILAACEIDHVTIEIRHGERELARIGSASTRRTAVA